MRLNSYEVALKKMYRLNEQLTKLGETVGAYITTQYLDFKVKELTVWHQELVRLEELKQIKKKQQAQLRAQKSSGDDVDELDEEIGVTESQLRRAKRAAEKLVGEERARMQLRIDEIEEEKRRLEEKYSRAISQAQLTRAGYVYVISNHGSFGEDVVKIGMTRRLEPMDRIIELGDASVPYKFDVHTLAFVEDAPKVERALHELFSENRVNKDNFRKEFFFTDPKIVKEAMGKMGVESDWYFEAEAKEFRESELIRTTLNAKKAA
ncbi:GIY-YIG nuclease family protein [Aeromonas caviae]